MADISSPLFVSQLLNAGLLAMLVALAFAVALTRSLIGAILLMSVYSLVCALWFLVMDAADVAFTEAVVGAGVSTVVLLGAILLTRARAVRTSLRQAWFPLLVVAVAGGVLSWAAMGLPQFGDFASPANAHVGRAYLERAGHDVGTPNIVTAVLASYRGFDTLGETVVIFAAAIAVALMLGFGERALSDTPAASRAPPGEALVQTDDHVVLRVAAKFLIPIIVLFAFYTQFHGDLGAGGGFQAGVILAVAIILHALVFGLAETMNAIPPAFVRSVSALGVLVYAGAGVVSIVNGGGFLDYDRLFPPGFEEAGGHVGQHVGIFVIELGVLLTVSATMVAVVYGFAGRAPDAITEEAPKPARRR